MQTYQRASSELINQVGRAHGHPSNDPAQCVGARLLRPRKDSLGADYSPLLQTPAVEFGMSTCLVSSCRVPESISRVHTAVELGQVASALALRYRRAFVGICGPWYGVSCVVDSPVHYLHARTLSLGCAFLLLKVAVPVHEFTQLNQLTSSWDPRVHACMLTLTFLWAPTYTFTWIMAIATCTQPTTCIVSRGCHACQSESYNARMRTRTMRT